MRIVFMGNNWVAWQVMRFLKSRGEEIVALLVHPDGRAQYRSELVETAQIAEDRILPGEKVRDGELLETIRELKPDVGLSIFFDYIFPPEFIELFPRGIINLHPSYLPYNRGQYPNVWSIVDRTPSGATLHYIDPGIDTGDIIAQREVKDNGRYTGETLYRELEKGCVSLFEETWPGIKDGTVEGKPQAQGEGTYHTRHDVDDIDEIDLDGTYVARDLIDRLRARTFPPYKGAYFMDNGEKVYLRVQLLTEEEL